MRKISRETIKNKEIKRNKN